MHNHDQDQGDIITASRKALTMVNDPPGVAVRGGILARVGQDDEGRSIIIPMTRQSTRSTLARAIGWRTVTNKGTSPAGVPGIVVDDFMGKADQLGLPVLEQIVTAPVFGPDGTLITAPGYARAARFWYQPVDGMEVPPVSEDPSRAEINSAGRLLMKEYLGEFPFDSEASRQHALGALLLPFAG